MLFNSYEFALYFLPLAVIGFFLIARFGGERPAAVWLAVASLAFYGYWTPRFVPLLLGSIAFNYAMALAIRHRVRQTTTPDRGARWLLGLAVAGNLALLGYYKYANFFLSNTFALARMDFTPLSIVLPLGISFFTFTQIAYLVDTLHGKAGDRTDPWHYLLFVTFFPHLIAGPILHHSEMMPQFGKRATYAFNWGQFAMGAAIFFIGLCKKVVFADGIQPYVAVIFDGSITKTPSLLEAWGGALAYTLQLYFDFSGYSDMAIGLALLFNIKLPLNFNSPYKAANISDFWRRWHMTLSRFLRDYLYIPLGGNRLGSARRYSNLIATMVLGGLWHGAAWTFVVWGALHGFYLCVHHIWQAFRRRISLDRAEPSQIGHATAVALTFVCVVVGWVFFRAGSIDEAIAILRGMAGFNGIQLPQSWESLPLVKEVVERGFVTLTPISRVEDSRQLLWIVSLLSVAFFLPNTQTLAAHAPLARLLETPERLGRALALGALIPLLFIILAINGSRGVSEFIYFNF